MSNLSLSIEATQNAIASAAISTDDLPRPQALETEAQPPVLITEQEVVFGTAAAVRPRSIPTTRRMTGVLRVVGAALRPPPRPQYARRAAYLERAAMSREMDRL
ncbi:hypothetical protein [Mycobacterium sp.]|uniref:hypothetical protein n=1 Tax=Mycobacterium sp. TaxID=1785 RepID=UPI003C741523